MAGDGEQPGVIRRRAAALAAAVAIGCGTAGAGALTSSGPAPAAREARDHAAVDVFVRGADHEQAGAAAVDAGMTVTARFRTLGFVAASGSADQVRRVERDARASAVVPQPEIVLDLESSHRATRTADAHAGVAELGVPSTTGRGVTIAVNDSGIEGTHPMLKSQVVRNLRYTGLGHVDVPDSDPAGGHGTHVAGIAAGGRVQTMNGRKLVGAAPGAKLVGLGSGAANRVIGAVAGLEWVLENHADPCGNGACPPIRVVNNSWGSTASYSPNDPVSVAVRSLVRRGVVVVFSAGNRGGDGSTIATNGYAQDPTPGVISVAAYDDAGDGRRNGSLASFSSRGKAGRPSSYPDVSAPGVRITSSCRPTLPLCQSAEDLDYGSASGTSMAAPHVSGIVALLLEANPTLTPAQVEDVLEDTAHPFSGGGAYERDPANDTTPTSFDKGHGLVDSLAAVAAARSLPGASPASAGGAAPVESAGSVVPTAPDSHSHRPPPTAPLPLPLTPLPPVDLPSAPVPVDRGRQEDLLQTLSNL